MTDPQLHDDEALDAALDLLDHQIVDRDGVPIGKVDDLELIWRDGAAHLAAILVGPGAWGARMPGLFGRLVEAGWRRVRPEQDRSPLRIPLERITQLDSAVHVDVRRADLQIEGVEAWIDRRVISKIPGARHEP